MAALQKPLPQAVRLNPLKVDPAAAIGGLAVRYGWEVQPVPFCDTGWQVTGAGAPPSATLEFRMGHYYIQDAASMLPAELFDWPSAPAAPLVLDLAAAPGGKSTHLIAKTGDRGLLIANDSSAGRIPALRGVLRDWGAVNAAVTNFPGERFGAWFPGQFDRVLLDAPCSMENLRPSGAHPRRFTSARERADLAARQLRLLESAVQALRVGGQVVYSTCTLAPEEDEAVLDGLLRRYPGALRVEPVLGGAAPALAGDGAQSFHPDVAGAARLWPHLFGTSGFFAACLTKLSEVSPPVQSEPPQRDLARAGWQRLPQREARALDQFLLDTYGFDLTALLERQELSLWKWGEGLYLLPEWLLRRYAGLPVASAGLLLGAPAAAGIELAHEFAARFAAGFQRGAFTLPPADLPNWLRGGDHPEAPAGAPRGAIVWVRDADGRFVGLGRVQSGRIKNRLPRRLAER